MEGECEVLLDATVDTEVSKRSTQSVKPSSKLTAALLVFILCLAAAAAVHVSNRHVKVGTQLLVSELVSELLKGLDVSHSEWSNSSEPSHSLIVSLFSFS